LSTPDVLKKLQSIFSRDYDIRTTTTDAMEFTSWFLILFGLIILPYGSILPIGLLLLAALSYFYQIPCEWEHIQGGYWMAWFNVAFANIVAK
jgi:hypothetical protein